MYNTYQNSIGVREESQGLTGFGPPWDRRRADVGPTSWPTVACLGLPQTESKPMPQVVFFQLGSHLGPNLGPTWFPTWVPIWVQLGSRQKWQQLRETNFFQFGSQLRSQLGPQLGSQLGATLGPNLGPTCVYMRTNLGPHLGPNLGPNLGQQVGPRFGPEFGPNFGPTLRSVLLIDLMEYLSSSHGVSTSVIVQWRCPIHNKQSKIQL